MRKTLLVLAALTLVAAAAFAGGSKSREPEPEMKSIVEIAVEDGRFTTLVTALEAAGLTDTLNGSGPYTVFAPTDEAFAKLPEGTVEYLLDNTDALREVLLYHVAPGKVMSSDVVKLDSADTAAGEPVQIRVSDGRVMINESQVVIADIEASNGVIHVVNGVLLPPADDQDIVSIAVEDGRFTTLVSALQAADLVGTLQGEGPFTVFAPTDEAFSQLPDGTVDALLNDIPTLRNVLLYHVVPGSLTASEVVSLNSASTASGEMVRIKIENDRVMINEAQLIITDIKASNGVIHVIDRVILPPSA